MSLAGDFLRLARPREWIKAAFVLLPAPFVAADGARVEALPLLLGAAGFCLLGSAGYVFNDLCDRERDRHHPRKRDRPLAAGRVGAGAAGLLSLLLALGGLGLLARWPGALRAGAAYVALSLLYSAWAKHVPLVDVFLLSGGFVLRVLAGCALVGAPPSSWLLLCTSTLALFLAFAKRRADLAEGVGGAHRPSLEGYDDAFLRQGMTVTAGLALLSYALYCMSSSAFQPDREFASVPFAAFGLLECLRLAQAHGRGASPWDLLARPRVLAAAAGWAAAVAWGIDLPRAG